MTAADNAPLPQLNYDLLRARFKQLQSQTNNVHQNWQIRIHRAMSWMKRSNELPADQLDLKVILLWIALNAMYARWDAEDNAPGRDTSARKRFLQWACQVDHDLIERFMRRYRPLVKKLLENFFL